MPSIPPELTPALEQELLALAKVYLPNAEIDEVRFSTSCGCYSEYTTDPTYFHARFTAPWEGTDRDLSKVVDPLEDAIKDWAQNHFEWQGCDCCCGENMPTDTLESVYVRVIPVRAT